MNKRQAKKASKKVTWPLVDEFYLITLSSEEYKKAMEDFHQHIQKHCRYKHYRDRYKKGGKPFSYHFLVGEVSKKYMEEMFKLTRKFGQRKNME